MKSKLIMLIVSAAVSLVSFAHGEMDCSGGVCVLKPEKEVKILALEHGEDSEYNGIVDSIEGEITAIKDIPSDGTPFVLIIKESDKADLEKTGVDDTRLAVVTEKGVKYDNKLFGSDKAAMEQLKELILKVFREKSL